MGPAEKKDYNQIKFMTGFLILYVFNRGSGWKFVIYKDNAYIKVYT